MNYSTQKRTVKVPVNGYQPMDKGSAITTLAEAFMVVCHPGIALSARYYKGGFVSREKNNASSRHQIVEGAVVLFERSSKEIQLLTKSDMLPKIKPTLLCSLYSRCALTHSSIYF